MVNKEVLVDGSEAGWAGEKSNDSVIFYINQIPDEKDSSNKYAEKKYLNFPALSFWLRPVVAGKNLAGLAKISISSWLSTQLTSDFNARLARRLKSLAFCFSFSSILVHLR